jgi:hypothetical protein
MNLANLTPLQLIVIVAIVLVVVAVIIFAIRKSRTAHLRRKFGKAEYERTIAERGGTGRGEAVLEQRAKRVESFHLRTLSATDRERFLERWASVQAHFVDGPAGAVTEADQLLGDVLAARGYPVGDFETRAADISVDHPLVQNYRAGHAIAVRHLKGEATTEDLRRAMIHYRALFEDLVSGSAAATVEPRADYPSTASYKTR